MAFHETDLILRVFNSLKRCLKFKIHSGRLEGLTLELQKIEN